MNDIARDGRAFWDSVSCRKYTGGNNCLVRGVQRKLFLYSIFKKREVLSKNSFATPLKMLRIVYLRCRSSLLVVCGSRIWLENPQALTVRAQLLL